MGPACVSFKAGHFPEPRSDPDTGSQLRAFSRCKLVCDVLGIAAPKVSVAQKPGRIFRILADFLPSARSPGDDFRPAPTPNGSKMQCLYDQPNFSTEMSIRVMLN